MRVDHVSIDDHNWNRKSYISVIHYYLIVVDVSVHKELISWVEGLTKETIQAALIWTGTWPVEDMWETLHGSIHEQLCAWGA